MAQKSTRQPLGLSPEEIDLRMEDCQDKLNEVEDDLMEAADGRALITSEFVHRVFRAFRSVKSAANLLGNDPLKELSHTAEKVLGAIAEGRIDLSVENAEALLSVVARLKQMAVDRAPFVQVDYSQEAEELDFLLKTPLDSPPQTPRPQEAHPRSVARPPAEMHSPRDLKILLVEDDFTSRVVLQGLLRAYGNCHVAVNGNEAVEAFRAARNSSEGYDLICMDVRLPEMDGTEAVQQIRAIEEKQGVYSASGVKIFMTTAIRDLKTVRTSYRALCDAYLIKPIDGAQLEQQLLAFGLIQAPVES